MSNEMAWAIAVILVGIGVGVAGVAACLKRIIEILEKWR